MIAQCPDCIGEIKRVDATGKCISCFPCPECYDHDGHITSSVPCGATVSYDTDIECVEIQVAPPPSSQRSVASKFTATPVTPILPTSSSFRLLLPSALYEVKILGQRESQRLIKQCHQVLITQIGRRTHR